MAAQFDSLLAGAPLGIGVFDRDLRHVRVNAVLAEMNGRPAHELVGRTPSEVNPVVGAQAEALYRQVMDSGVPMRDVRLTGEVSARPGQVRHWSTTFHPVRQDGEVVGLCVVVADVTSETELARTLAESARRIEQITENMAVGYLALDADWRITFANRHAAEALGRPGGELVGGVIWELFPATVGTAFEAGYRRAAETGEAVVFDAYYPPPLDAWFEVRAVPDPPGVALYFLDVTERVQARRDAETVARRAQLLARLSGELAGHRDLDQALQALPRLLAPGVADWCVVTLLEESERAEAAVRHLTARSRSGDLAEAEPAVVADVLAHLRDVAAHHADPAAGAWVQEYARTRLDSYRDRARTAPGPVPPPFLVRALVAAEATVVGGDATPEVQATLAPGRAARALAVLDPRAAVAVAVRARGRVLGVLTLCWDRRPPGAPPHASASASPASELGADPVATPTARAAATPDADVLAFVQTVADRIGAALDEAQLVRQQLRAAEQLQRSLLTDPPEPDHAHVVARYTPATDVVQVGGDWYDAFLQDDGATVLVIGDVLGHDTTAAAAMGQVRTLVRAAAVMPARGPAATLSAVDGAMRTLSVGTTATCVVARLEQEPEQVARGTTTLRWSNAGHPPPVLVLPDGRVRLLDEHRPDLLLGIEPSLPRDEHVLEVPRGSTVVLYTDGLVERRTESLDTGLDRLRAAARAAAAGEERDADGFGQDLDAFCDDLVARVLPGQPVDDVALIAVRLHRQDRPRPVAAGPRRLPPGIPDEPEVLRG
nr:SpoIIE family protein phosphatase [Kineococcus aurantiacus]